MIIILAQFFLCLSILIVLHEAGHFFAARMFNTKVEKFYLFFNPWFSLFKKKIGDTTYGVGWLPLGGYVKIAGMIDESMDQEQMKKPAKDWEFRSKPRWQRLIIMLGGVFVNFVLAFFIYIFMFCVWGEKVIEQKPLSVYSGEYDFPLMSGDEIISINGEDITEKSADHVFFDLILWGEKDLVISRGGERLELFFTQENINLLVNRSVVINDAPFKIKSVSESIFLTDSILIDGPALTAGLEDGDVLLSINGDSFSGVNEFVSFFQNNPQKTVSVEYKRDEIIEKTELHIPTASLTGNVAIGVELDLKKNEPKIIEHSFFNSIPAAWNRTKTEISNYLGQFGLLFKMDDGAKQLGGFMMIGSLFGTEDDQGKVYWDWENFWKWTAFISIMLAIVNLLPIPALDGGHVVILLIEMVIRRDINPKILGYIQVVGMILLLGLFVLANANDVMRFFFN